MSHRCSSLNSLKALGRSTDTSEPELLRSCLAHAISRWLPRLAVQKYSTEVHFRLKQGAADSCSRPVEPCFTPQWLHCPQPDYMELPLWRWGRALPPFKSNSSAS